MTIKQFLQKTIDNELTVDQQKKYLIENPFGLVRSNLIEEKANQLAEAVEFLYSQMPETPELPYAIDICGTGGSGLPRINTSTISAFVAAGAGVKVAKHGNNASSGRFGSFDLLEALDVPTILSSDQLKLRFNENNLAFLYANSFHPIMQYFGPVRSEIKSPTFFNILGPLLSPVKASKQLIGTPKIEFGEIIIEVSKLLKKHRVMVVVGSDGLDEITLTGPTTVFELRNGTIKKYQLNPEDFGSKTVESFDEISSGSKKENIHLVSEIIKDKEHSAKSELVLVNAAAAIYLSSMTNNFRSAYKVASKSISSGAAEKTLEAYKRPSVLQKIAKRDHDRDFSIHKSVDKKRKKYEGGLIAEIKKRSPSQRLINNKVDVASQAVIYEKAGARAISVLSEPEDFGGSFEDLIKVTSTVNVPILCKDFILRKEHIDKALASGADIILLIVAMLDKPKLSSLHKYATSLGLQVLVEVHSDSELETALTVNPKLIGVNARNLHDFSLSLGLFQELAKKIPDDITKIAESGIRYYRDIPKGFDGILVGTELMRHPFSQLKIKEFEGRPLLKLCGIRSLEAARLCEKLCVDMIGVNFVPRSRRKVDVNLARQITQVCKNSICVGVFENQSAHEVNRISKEVGLDAVQLSGNEENLDLYELPIIKTIRIGEDKPKQAFLTLIDSEVSGSGKSIDPSNIVEHEPSLVAGGVNLEIAKNLLGSKKPLGIDTASGIETNNQVNQSKIKNFAELFDATKY